MEMVAATHTKGAVPPFHDHDVREWSRIDSLTGVLEKARLETDQWTANTNNSSHKYGKVVDSRARTNADGALQQQARRQLEVYQSQIPGGRLQVIKTQTVSSSRWSNKTAELPVKEFENLQLTLNPLDLTSQKSKVDVGRSVGRRPPSRPRGRDESIISSNPLSENLQRVSRICHQVHENAVKQVFEANNNLERTSDIFNGHNSLTRTKSTSSEELFANDDKSVKSSEDLEDLEQLQNWRRSSKIRRSLQYTKNNSGKPTNSKPDDLPENSGSVRKIREELEKGRRLNTALRGNNVDLEALDQILQTISNSSEEETKKQKINSFVSVETLQQVRGRLRRTSTDTSLNNKEETDDGIVTEDNEKMNSQIRSYVFGMDSPRKPIVGTGSLESRNKLSNGSTNLRNEDWYNRRKSYGFEQVHNHSQSPNSISLRSNGKVESSTDSGICRSSEIVAPTKIGVKQMSSFFDQGRDLKSTTITIPITSPWDEDKDVKRHSIAVDESKYVRRPKYNDDFLNLDSRRSKKVEFCKTEVHFAADSGKVNIVETDEKPPPTHNFRRRRRNSGTLLDPDFNTNGLPVLHFGDSLYEKTLLGVGDQDDFSIASQPIEIDSIYENVNHSKLSYGNVTVNTSFNDDNYKNSNDTTQEDDSKRYYESVKGILKNKPIKPKPYHLGEEVFLNSNSNSDSDTGKWGVKLKPVHKKEPLFWKSTVTLQNTVYGQETKDEQPEFQKLLHNLRPTNNNINKPDLISNSTTVKLNEDKVYSTRVNFGDGGTTVVENNNRFAEQSDNSIKGVNVKHFGTDDVFLTQESNNIELTNKNNNEFLSQPNEDLSSPSLVGRNCHFANISDTKLQEKHSSNDIVLRQPKKSEMTYFGVKLSPKPVKKLITDNKKSVIKQENKPDLLQHMKISSPAPNDQPIYENVPSSNSNIIDELTKAADQILKAVNGFDDDEECDKEVLETISESKSWKEEKKTKVVNSSRNVKNTTTKIKHTSSTSSVESVSREGRKLVSGQLKKPVETRTSQIRRKNSSHETNTSVTNKAAATKARRLQRASSREALLQSHGSSSEDLGTTVEAPQRKPRQIKKTKVTQLTVTNGIEISKKSSTPNPPRRRRDEIKIKSDNKVNAVPEIRHKTAISTIKTVADKEKSNRERSRTRTEDSRHRIPHQKRDVSRGLSTSSRSTPRKSVSSNKETVNHRVSTANIKKCQRADGAPRH